MLTDPIWISSSYCDAPHRLTHPERAVELFNDIAEHGWRFGSPACIGYYFEGRVQLISGTHRLTACQWLRRSIPVALMTYDDAKKLWGTDAWVELLKNPPLVRHWNLGAKL